MQAQQIEDRPDKVNASRGGTAPGRGPELFKVILPQLYLPLVLLVIVGIGYLVTPNFLSVRNFNNVISFSSIIAILAIGQFYVILTGGIDLSVGANLALSTVVAALTLHTGMDAGLATLITLGTCMAVGLGNGVLVVWLRIPPFIATLAMMTMVQGFSYIIQSTSLIQIICDLVLGRFGSRHFESDLHLPCRHLDRSLHQSLLDLRPSSLRDRRKARGGAAVGTAGRPRPARDLFDLGLPGRSRRSPDRRATAAGFLACGARL